MEFGKDAADCGSRKGWERPLGYNFALYDTAARRTP